MITLNFRMDHILYQVFKTILGILSKKHNTFKIKAGDFFELLMPETFQLLGTAKNKIAKDENGENVSHLEITEVVLVHCNIVNNDYQHDSRVLYTFIPNKLFVELLDISPKNEYF